ncbi:MAG TPA: phosphatidylinositol mannoside acyltransferase [Jatrophihabitans sp.]
MLHGLRGRAVDLGYAAGWGAIKYAPSSLSHVAFRGAADLAAHRNGKGTRQLRKNLGRIITPGASEDELDELVAEGLRSYSRYWLETFRLPRMDPADIAERVDTQTEGIENLDGALAKGRGVVLALPHQGNWDVAGVWLVAHSGPFVTVAERLKPESLFERFVAYRESLGFEVLALSGGEQTPMSVLTERMQQNKVACLLADRDLSRNGIDVTFFGEAARMPAGPALLAATTGAALLPVSLWFTPDGWAQRINPPVPIPPVEGTGRLRAQVEQMTQAMADSFARDIAEHPADWHMLQKFWLADLPARRDG